MFRPQRPTSLAWRVTLFVGIAISLCLIVLGLTVQRSIENHFALQDADELHVVAEAVHRTLTQTRADHNALTDALEHAVSGHHGVYFWVSDSDNQLLYASPGPDLSRITHTLSPVPRIDRHTLSRWQEGGHDYRGATLRMHIKTNTGTSLFFVTVASEMDFHLNYLNRFQWILWIIMAAACAITLLAARLAVHQGHEPLRHFSARISSMHSDQLSTRLDSTQAPIELLNLVNTFNDMLERIEDVFQRLSNFSADIAHELRTPITNLMTQAQVTLGKARTVDEYRELLYSNLEEYERLAKMVSDMLWLAKTDNGLLKPTFSPLDLETELRALFDYFEPLAEEKNITLSLQGHAAEVQGDRAMLRQALSNILSNAIRYTPANNTITAMLEVADDSVKLSVENPGSDIPEKHIDKLFNRFYRADPSRQRDTDGAGLGLAIAQAVIQIHNGFINVHSSHGITIFTITLPRKPTAFNLNGEK